MKNDHEVKLYMSERRKGSAQHVAAARAGMSERTARKYERVGKLPSELKRPHTWVTRANPFEQDWPWVMEQSNAIPPCKPRPCLLCSVKHILVGIVPPRIAPYDAISPGGEHCMGRIKR